MASYIQDTTHFLATCESFAGNIPQNSILVAFDVRSIYTNISHDEGINYCSVALQVFYGRNIPLLLRHSIQFIEFILKRKNSEFRNSFYLQIHGIIMGSPYAPKYVEILMDTIERLILNSAPGDNSQSYVYA